MIIKSRSHGESRKQVTAMSRPYSHDDARQRAILRQRQTERIEALERGHGRLLLDIEEQIGSCIKWPYRFTEMMLSRHLRFPERWQLTLFLLGNRCPPTLMVEWYLKRDMLSDKSARDQVSDLIRQHKTGKLEQQGRTTWVMDATVTKPIWERKHPWDGVGESPENKTQVIETPSFAFDWEHNYHWDEAVKMLQAGVPGGGVPKLFAERAEPPSIPTAAHKDRVPTFGQSGHVGFQFASPPPRSDKAELLQTWAAEMREKRAADAGESTEVDLYDNSPIAEALAKRRFLQP